MGFDGIRGGINRMLGISGASEVKDTNKTGKVEEKKAKFGHTEKSDVIKKFEKDYGSTVTKLLTSLATGKATYKELNKLDRMISKESDKHIFGKKSQAAEKFFGTYETYVSARNERVRDLKLESSMNKINTNKSNEHESFSVTVDGVKWDCQQRGKASFTLTNKFNEKLGIHEGKVSYIEDSKTMKPQKIDFTNPNELPASLKDVIIRLGDVL